MRVKLIREYGAQYRCTNEAGESIILSGTPEIGPSDAGVRPMEAVLMALAGCSTVDVQNILQKGRHRIDALEVSVEAARADAIPAVFDEITLHFEAAGDFSLAKLQRAADLSMEKYCSVARMLGPTVAISHRCSLLVRS